MGLGDRTLSRCFGAAIVPVDVLARRPSNSQMRALAARSAWRELNRAHGPVDRHAGIAELRGKPFDNDIGIGDVARFAHEPIAHREREAEPLSGKRCGKIGHGAYPSLPKRRRGLKRWALEHLVGNLEIGIDVLHVV